MISRTLSELFLSDTPLDVYDLIHIHLPNLSCQLEACIDQALRLKIDDDAIHTIVSRSSIQASEWPVYATLSPPCTGLHIAWLQYNGDIDPLLVRSVIRDGDDNYLGSGSHAL
jgi:hypothetical protein